jgi:hypothetical protein
MTLEVEFWTLVSLAVTFLFAIIGIVGGLIRGVLTQGMRRIDGHFQSLEDAQKERADDVARRLGTIEPAAHESAGHRQRLEREALQFQASLPKEYVRREDYVQMVATIVAKLDASQARSDAMSARLENKLLKEAKNG